MKRRPDSSDHHLATLLNPLPALIADRLLWFDDLTGTPATHGVITLGWRFVDAIHTDLWSARFTAFKCGDQRHIHAICDIAAHALRLIAWTTIPGAIGIAAAISADDERLNLASPVATLARHLAERFHFKDRTDILSKRPHRALHTLLHIADRAAEISGSYICIEPPDCALLIVCDDFVTSGETFNEIARAVHAKSSTTQIIGVALARNERQSYAAENGLTLTNDHIPASWTNIWERHVRHQAHRYQFTERCRPSIPTPEPGAERETRMTRDRLER
jgi:hypothetical protein